MDLEYTFWQMYLMCTNPKVVYRHTMYRKREFPVLQPDPTRAVLRVVRRSRRGSPPCGSIPATIVRVVAGTRCVS